MPSLLLRVRVLALVGVLLVCCACTQDKPVTPSPTPAKHTLTILHTNDTHASFGGLTDKGLTCYAALCENGKGGYVRLEQAVRAVRTKTPDALFLDAGDIFQGTLFWVQHKERMPAALIDAMDYQAIIPGNHEFDEGADTYLRLVNTIKTPVLGANLRFAPGTPHPVKPYTIFEREGRKIGIIGVVTPETPALSSPGPTVQFDDVKEILQQTVTGLEAKGINIIIALTHVGLEHDRALAREINGLDIIVGGHSHSLLSNTPELHNPAQGPYPVVEKTPNGAPALVVTAYTDCIYLGKLEVEFDTKGIAHAWQGEAIPLDDATLKTMNAPAPNTGIVQQVNDFAKPVKALMNATIGFIKADKSDGLPLEEPNIRVCRRQECRTGNIMADALRLTAFNDVQLALLNGGALRSALPQGRVTHGHVLGTLPFRNAPVKTRMRGDILMQVLEHGVSRYGEDDGRFLQVSGLRYAFSPANPVGSRITKVEALGMDNQWHALDLSEHYMVVTQEYMARGGDSYTMLEPLQWHKGNRLASEVLGLFIETHSPVEARLEGRIKIQ